jgi:hypothetical protein
MGQVGTCILLHDSNPQHAALVMSSSWMVFLSSFLGFFLMAFNVSKLRHQISHNYWRQRAEKQQQLNARFWSVVVYVVQMCAHFRFEMGVGFSCWYIALAWIYRYLKQLLPLLFAGPAEVVLFRTVSWHSLIYETDENRLPVSLTLDPNRNYTFEYLMEGGWASPIENITWFYNGGDISDYQALQRRFDDVGLNLLQYVKDSMGQVDTCILHDDSNPQHAALVMSSSWMAFLWFLFSVFF